MAGIAYHHLKLKFDILFSFQTRDQVELLEQIPSRLFPNDSSSTNQCLATWPVGLCLSAISLQFSVSLPSTALSFLKAYSMFLA